MEIAVTEEQAERLIKALETIAAKMSQPSPFVPYWPTNPVQTQDDVRICYGRLVDE